MVVQLEQEAVVKETQFQRRQESHTMKNKIIYILLILFTTQISVGQEKEPKTISGLLKKHNSKSVPYISVQELAMPSIEAIILDSREQKEYETSHLKDAICVGYDYFSVDSIQSQLPNKGAKIVVYCSLGIRSETVAEKLKKAGYTNVYNLYGGIFEWKNKNFKVYNSEENETENVHTFNEAWSKWLLKGNKIYEKLETRN
jgi:rhodanese-related sulfurtransferase